MKTKTFLSVVFILGAVVSYGQTVASSGSASDFLAYNTVAASHLSYNIVESNDNVVFESINYSAANQKLELNTKDEILFISVYKDGEVYLQNMPIMTSELNFSMQNYDAGDYELHLSTAGKIVPTVITLNKN